MPYVLNHRRDPRDHTAFFATRLDRSLTATGHGTSLAERLGITSTSGVMKPKVILSSSHFLTHYQALPVWDQGQEGSCTAHATCTALFNINFVEWKDHFNPSRSYVYNTTRQYAHDSLTKDTGAFVFDACAAVERARICSLDAFPYSAATFQIAPPLSAIKSAATTPWQPFDFVCLMSNEPTTPDDFIKIKNALSHNCAVVFGFYVYRDVMEAAGREPYVLKTPQTSAKCIGAHCVCLVGYDDTFSSSSDGSGAFLAHNSWYWNSPGDPGYVAWGNAKVTPGCFWITYEYMKQNAYDFYACGSSTG